MARLKTTNLNAENALVCATCGKNLSNPADDDVGRTGVWDARFAPQGVFHCENGAAAFCRIRSAHHTPLRPHEPCWRCHRHLGCARCTSADMDDLWCGVCGVWQSQSALLRGGVNRGIKLGNHPPEWIRAYIRSVEFLDDTSALNPVRAYIAERQRLAAKRGERYEASAADPWIVTFKSMWDTYVRQQRSAVAEYLGESADRHPGQEG